MKTSIHALFALLVVGVASVAAVQDARPGSEDFTVTWRQFVPSIETPLPLLLVDETEITIRPLPREKPKDPAKARLFIGETGESKTFVYPGRWYHFAIVSRGGSAQLFVNGFADAQASLAQPRVVKVADRAHDHVKDLTVDGRARSDDDILRQFKALLPPGLDVTTVAHRGVHAHAPENTRISYVMAIEAGAPIVEFDTALTKDGHIVGMHDKTVDRTTDGSGEIAQMTLEQVRKLDAGSWKHRKFKGEPVPTIDEVAEVVRGKAIFMLDLKSEGQGQAIADWLKKSGFPREQVILAPWTDEEGVALRRYLPDVPMIRLTSRIPTDKFDDAYFDRFKKMGFSGVSINWVNVTLEYVEAAKRNGLDVYLWTLNDAPDIAGALLMKADGIVTDDPAVTKKLIEQLTAQRRG